jgi:hypothetical protein
MKIIYLLTIAIVCSNCKNDKSEVRIKELSAQLASKDKAIKILNQKLDVSVAIARISVGNSPLKNFFEAPEFWATISEDPNACGNQCYRVYQAALQNCNTSPTLEERERCRTQAAVSQVDCIKGCGVDVFQPNR